MKIIKGFNKFNESFEGQDSSQVALDYLSEISNKLIKNLRSENYELPIEDFQINYQRLHDMEPKMELAEEYISTPKFPSLCSGKDEKGIKAEVLKILKLYGVVTDEEYNQELSSFSPTL